MDKLYQNDAKYDRTEVTELRFVKQGFEIFFFFNEFVLFLISYPFFYFSQRGQCDSLFRSVF